ncbi:MAG: hypothetical protein ABI887_15520 [Burkholderiales bacterium]
MTFQAQNAHGARHPTTGDFAAGRKTEELDPRIGGTVVAAIDDETEPTRLATSRELAEFHLEAVRRQDSILRRIRWVVVAEPARHSTARP